MTENRVVVTGMGVISPLGNGLSKFWKALMEGRSGIGPITRFDTTGFSTKIAAEVREFDPADYLDRKEAKRMDRFVQYAVAGAKMAVADAQLNLEAEDPDQIGVIFGSGIGGIETLEDQIGVLLQKGPNRISPFFIPMMIGNMAAGQISITLGVRGINQSLVNACATSANAIGDALTYLRRGDAQVIISGGSEASVTPSAVGGFCSMKALSARNEEPAKASRPFDLTRDGFVLGEGAGVLVLETLDHALGRGARIYAEVTGFGATADAYHITQPAPEGAGAARAMARALKDAGLRPEQVSYINAHGTSTELNDKFETMAIKTVFGEAAYKIPVSSIKSMIGHLLGAAGAVEAIASILSIQNSVVPPTINYEHPDPNCDLDYVPNVARELPLDVVISNSLGFGGHNATLVFQKFHS